ncbi:DegV family protein [Abyssisolibacter fermentans]|uniref:DegV family protein n=1 Tax=Abyssisolibacter fermentans TaxID=1766203 RepID=UPI000836AA23|nr:DegV family protein [Abyssisolibacter fermentans]
MIKIMADSTCDLPKDIIDKYNISIAPLIVNINGRSYRDKVDITANEFYEMFASLEKNPTTSMPSPDEYLKIINKAVEEGYTEILCICMSSGTSGAYQSAVIAKDYYFEEYPDSNVKIHVVDSKSMSHGSGWLILKSARMRENGATFEELVEFNEKYKKNIKHFLSIDDLSHLIRSGRLSNASAFIGKLLKLRPIMTMKHGKGSIVAKERGEKKVLKHYISEFIDRNDWYLTDFIIIGYTSAIEVANRLKDKILDETKFDGDIYIMQMGVAVGTHVGLGAISMFFLEKGHKMDNLLFNRMHELMEKKKEFIGKFKNK